VLGLIFRACERSGADGEGRIVGRTGARVGGHPSGPGKIPNWPRQDYQVILSLGRQLDKIIPPLSYDIRQSAKLFLEPVLHLAGVEVAVLGAEVVHDDAELGDRIQVGITAAGPQTAVEMSLIAVRQPKRRRKTAEISV